MNNNWLKAEGDCGSKIKVNLGHNLQLRLTSALIFVSLTLDPTVGKIPLIRDTEWMRYPGLHSLLSLGFHKYPLVHQLEDEQLMRTLRYVARRANHYANPCTTEALRNMDKLTGRAAQW